MVFRLFKSKYDSLMDYIDELRFKIIYFFDEDIYDYISETKLYMLFILVPNVLLIICTLGFIPSSLARYIYFFLCIYSIYNTATFFSRSRIYQIFDDSSRVLDEIYEGSTTSSSSSNSSSTGNSNHLGTCFDESSILKNIFKETFSVEDLVHVHLISQDLFILDLLKSIMKNMLNMEYL
ncbi:hypothetical protein C9374_001973 [Naegleria lovaniensis]|uniref:Uncharacterized protein n=1 Tax=Naegleria lovaniensis TaxID=51637 RepID=A0AA88GW46_NAELO|nr:uncharacterized protein C9374_001973 [Naegleria lovaniensis]KAG2386938.1 hypothetical protein C9374_001973 [Naegleria lovaniensis]